MKLNLILCGVCLPLTMIASSRTSEVKFGPKPYIDFLNADAARKYQTISKFGMSLDSNPEQLFKKGLNTIKLRGREPGSILKTLEIVPEDKKAEPIKINLENAKIVPPMKFMNNVLIGGDNSGTATFSYTIPADGKYTIRAKSWGPTEAANSFFVSINNSKEFIWDVPRSAEEPKRWTVVKPRSAGYYRPWAFILAWGATSPNSKFYNYPEFRKTAMALIKPAITSLAHRSVQPSELWFLGTLEAVNLWITDKRTDKKFAAELLKAMRPFVENCCKMVERHDGWCDNTPNIQIQAAAILGLAATMWKDTDPSTAKKWEKMAEECLERAWKWKLPDGPFVYSYGSGPDAGYYSYDGQNLTCYFLASKNPKARKALKDLAQGANNTTSFGHPVFLSSPWWKHCYKTFNRTKSDGVKLSIFPLIFSKNPLYASQIISDQRRLGKPYPDGNDKLVAYYNSLAPEFTCKPRKISDQTFFSKSDNGPFLRMGAYNVSMPWHSWCESTCGAYFSTPNAVVSQFCSTILTAITPDTKRKRVQAYYPIGYSVVEMVNPKPDIRTAIIDKSFIATATVFRPALGGPALPRFANQPNNSPWLRCDIYFADANGYAGTTELKALRDNDSTRIAMWTRCSVEKLNIGETTISVPGMSLKLEKQFAGKLINRGKIWGPPHGFYPLDLIESTVDDSNGKGYKKGSRFAMKISLGFTGKARLTVDKHESDNDLEKLVISKDGKFYATLLFNRSKESRDFNCDHNYSSIIQSRSVGGESVTIPVVNKLKLPAHSLTICR